MNYKECLEYLENENKKNGIIMGLEPIKHMLDVLDHPENILKIIHVAGTNGKGSVSAMLAGILAEAGYKTGRYVSPAVADYTEIIQWNNNGNIEYITEDNIAKYITYLADIQNRDDMFSKGILRKLTRFEMETVMSFLALKDMKCDYAIIECGLGGTEDATNAIDNKEMCIFTSISKDHVNILGNTISDIALAKAGIITDNIPVVSSIQLNEAKEVLDNEAHKKHTSVVYAPECIDCEYNSDGTGFTLKNRRYHINMPGIYQPGNAATAITAAKILLRDKNTLTEEVIDRALKKVRWHARFEMISDDPYIIFDGAHNIAGINALMKSIDAIYPRDMYQRIAVMGVFKDKAVDDMIQLTYGRFDEMHTVTAVKPRGLDASVLADRFSGDCGFRVYPHDEEPAADIARKVARTGKTPEGKKNVIIVFGSLSLYESFVTEFK